MGTNLLAAITLNENFSFGALTVCAMCTLVIIANTLRRKIPFLRRSMLPTAVIAGLLGLAVKEIVLAITKVNIFSMTTLNGMIFHLLSVGFIALCLREKDDHRNKSTEDTDAKIKRVNPFKSGSIIVSTYLMQAVISVLVTVLLAVTFMPELNKAAGLILPLGFGQGPNQAYNTGGIVWDNTVFEAWGGQAAGGNFGLTVAAFGFLWAAIAGVIILNRIAKKRGVNLRNNEYQTSGEVNSHIIEEKEEIPLSESVDKFTIQMCIVGLVYLLTIGVLVGLDVILQLTNVKFLVNFIPTIWGFGFMVAVVLALGAKALMRKLFSKGIMKRKYLNSYMMSRIGNFSFDISITAALCAIALTELGSLWIPILIMTSLGGAASIFFIRWICNRVYKGYADEGFIAMFGMLTGTISNGMILLRELDPQFKTPAADDLVAGSSTGIILGFPLLLLIQQAPTGNNIWWVMGIIIVYLVALMMFQMGWFQKIFRRKTLVAPTPSDTNEDPDTSETPTEQTESNA
jgi:ESS family glutamate:Na+ symporter